MLDQPQTIQSHMAAGPTLNNPYIFC